MSDANEREVAILARCSRDAAQYVANLPEHPLYPEVLSRLEALPGSLFELDVEHAFYESLRVRMRENGKAQNPPQ